MKVSVNLFPSDRIGIKTDRDNWVDTLEICATTSNPIMIVDHYIMIIDVPRYLLEFISQAQTKIHHQDYIAMDNPKCYVHVYSWETFLKNHYDEWKIIKTHDPHCIFNDKLIGLCGWVVGHFETCNLR